MLSRLSSAAINQLCFNYAPEVARDPGVQARDSHIRANVRYALRRDDVESTMIVARTYGGAPHAVMELSMIKTPAELSPGATLLLDLLPTPERVRIAAACLDNLQIEHDQAAWLGALADAAPSFVNLAPYSPALLGLFAALVPNGVYQSGVYGGLIKVRTREGRAPSVQLTYCPHPERHKDELLRAFRDAGAQVPEFA